ncbi:MAG: hypothetical protein H0U73_01135 [Tatlockia sp.]|nr:hypothetical protein [Tatlockia sp.]
MHLVIYFCGTANPGHTFHDQFDYADFLPKIFVKGCDSKEVCDSSIFPNLHDFACRFTNTLFDKKSNKLAKLSVSALESLGIRLDRTDLKGKEDEEIESITLCGYSRGAVTCFEVAKVLHLIAPNIPVDIVADQPVPGNSYSVIGSNAASIIDCSNLSNLKNVSIILGSYTGTNNLVDIHVKFEMPTDINDYQNSYLFVKSKIYFVGVNGLEELKFRPNFKEEFFSELRIDLSVEGEHSILSEEMNDITDHYEPEACYESTSHLYVHRGFFSQIVPQLPRTTNRELVLIPQENHREATKNSHMLLAKSLNKKGLVSDENLDKKINQVKGIYQIEGINTKPFPQVSKLQGFFGLKSTLVYRYIDQYNPNTHARQGMGWNKNETLLQWWEIQDKKASYFSTQLTKNLKETIGKTRNDNVDELKKLFQQADSWLIAKNNSYTSRYSQVESLRNNIFENLVNNLGVSSEELFKTNRETLHEMNYFQKHWLKESARVAFTKTDETRVLDKAFADHAAQEPSKETDEKLLKALVNWTDIKIETKSKSKRMDLVLDITEQLTTVIKNCYANQVESDLTQNLQI